MLGSGVEGPVDGAMHVQPPYAKAPVTAPLDEKHERRAA